MGVRFKKWNNIKESFQLSLSGVSESALEDQTSLGLEVATLLEVKKCQRNAYAI